MNQQEVQAVIDYFADKSLTFGCILKDKGDGVLYSFVEWHFNSCPLVLPVSSIGKDWNEDNCVYQDTAFSMGGIGEEGSDEYINLGHPVFIGDVLEKMRVIVKSLDFIYGDGNTILELIRLWQPFGFTKSLQEIRDKSGFVRVLMCGNCETDNCGYYRNEDHDRYNSERLKDSNVRALFEFLNTLI